MPTSAAGGPRLPVVFDEASWADDVRRIGDRGRALAETARRRLERDGVPLAKLHRCQPEGPSGTALPGCVKLLLDALAPLEEDSRAYWSRRAALPWN
jgi:hypothetical protein